MWIRLHVLVLVACALLVALGPAARAKKGRRGDFWGGIVDPGREQFEAAVARGEQLYERARRMGSRARRLEVVQRALAEFAKATGHSPRNFLGWYRRGQVLLVLDRTEEGIDALLRARALGAKGARVQFNIAFELGIAYSKTGAFEKAVVEYDRADRVAVEATERGFSSRVNRSTVHGNAAEALMALGRLDEAIQRYKESLSHVASNTLVLYGLAVAYDRDEQISKAQQQMRKALASDPNMGKLTSPDVFFIPDGDIHNYFALGYLAKGDLDKAREHWKLFLEKLPNSQWAPRARAHLASLGGGGGREERGRRRERLAPEPGPLKGQQQAGARDRTAIRARVENYAYRLRSCYRAELRRQGDLTGQLRVTFTVNLRGRAERVRIARSGIRRPTLHKCVVDVIKGIYFSRPILDRPVRMELPIKFKP